MLENPTVTNFEGEPVTLDGTEPKFFELPLMDSLPRVMRTFDLPDDSMWEVKLRPPHRLHLQHLTTRIDSNGQILESTCYTQKDVERHGVEKVRRWIQEDRERKAQILRSFWSEDLGLLRENREDRIAIFDVRAFLWGEDLTVIESDFLSGVEASSTSEFFEKVEQHLESGGEPNLDEVLMHVCL